MKELPIQNAFPAVPESVHHKVLLALKEARIMKPAKRRFSVSLTVALLVILLLMGAAVATNQWGVLDYLFGGAQNADEETIKKVWPVEQTQTAHGVTATIDSILLDGNRIAVGWVFENTNPHEPVYMLLDVIQADGKPVLCDSNDGIDHSWLPDPFESRAHPEPVTKEGFTGIINGEAPQGDFDIIIRVAVWKPIQPIYTVRYADYQNKFGQTDFEMMKPTITEKNEQGYIVVTEDGEIRFTLPGEEHRGNVYIGSTPDEMASLQKFQREDMEFVIQLKADSIIPWYKELTTKGVFRFEDYAGRYTKAEIMPESIHLVAEITPEDGSYASAEAFIKSMTTMITDGLGNPLKFAHGVELPGIMPVRREDGTWFVKAEFINLPLPEAMPPILSVTFQRQDGKRMMMPLYIP